MKVWKTSQRVFSLKKPLVMAILNITPDSFSDGGQLLSVDDALRRVEKYLEEEADIIDIGGESTRPNSAQVSTEEEINRVVPVIEAIKKRFDAPVSIDTSKAEVARNAVESGAEIINDVSGLKFDEKIAEVAFQMETGLVLMHLRGTFETMHKMPPVKNILPEVSEGLRWSVEKAKAYGISDEQIALDIGIGFSKTLEQNLELIAKLDKICEEFSNHPMLVGTSRKSFIGKILHGAPADKRIYGSTASAALAVWNGANIVRVHDVKATVETLKIVQAVKNSL